MLRVLASCLDYIPNIIIAADKTGNFYEMEPDNYKKFLRDKITKDYERDDIIGVETLIEKLLQLLQR